MKSDLLNHVGVGITICTAGIGVTTKCMLDSLPHLPSSKPAVGTYHPSVLLTLD